MWYRMYRVRIFDMFWQGCHGIHDYWVRLAKAWQDPDSFVSYSGAATSSVACENCQQPPDTPFQDFPMMVCSGCLIQCWSIIVRSMHMKQNAALFTTPSTILLVNTRPVVLNMATESQGCHIYIQTCVEVSKACLPSLQLHQMSYRKMSCSENRRGLIDNIAEYQPQNICVK